MVRLWALAASPTANMAIKLLFFLKTAKRMRRFRETDGPCACPPERPERSRKTTCFAHPLRTLAPAPPLLPRFSQCDRASLRPANSSQGCCFTTFCHQKVAPKVSAMHRRRKPWCASRNDDFSYCHLFSAGRRPAYPRDVKMSDKEATAHRAPGTIVQNSEVFCDRSARCAAVSRSFSPRGLLWRFLRKKEQRKKRAEACKTSCPVFAQIESLQLFLLRTFGLTQKYQKVKHGEKARETFGVSLKRAPVAGLQANRPRFLTFDTVRFFFRAFRSAVVQAKVLQVLREDVFYHLLPPKGGAKSVRKAPSSGSDDGSH